MQRKSNNQIKNEVLRELRWDSRIGWRDAEYLDVTVHEGVVTLTGTVTSYAKKVAAQEAAHRIVEVLDVANDIEVKLTREQIRTDTESAEAVRAALKWDALVPDESITSSVSDGWVTLEGQVHSLREREDAERVVRRLLGVRGLTNEIVVIPAKIAPDELKTSIEDALERRADREAERIRVEVSDGTVDLWGRVHSWQERRAVVGSISHAPGVSTVHDHLRIDPFF
ncbi:MAG: BON domain-containing protein [Pyrinomonadaceae bacterium]